MLQLTVANLPLAMQPMPIVNSYPNGLNTGTNALMRGFSVVTGNPVDLVPINPSRATAQSLSPLAEFEVDDYEIYNSRLVAGDFLTGPNATIAQINGAAAAVFGYPLFTFLTAYCPAPVLTGGNEFGNVYPNDITLPFCRTWWNPLVTDLGVFTTMSCSLLGRIAAKISGSLYFSVASFNFPNRSSIPLAYYGTSTLSNKTMMIEGPMPASQMGAKK